MSNTNFQSRAAVKKQAMKKQMCKGSVKSLVARKNLIVSESLIARSRRFAVVLLCVAGATFGAACRQDMHDQPRYEVYEGSEFFADGRASRNLPANVVARGYLREDDAYYLGKTGGAAQAGGPNTSSGQIQGAQGAGNNAGAQNAVGLTTGANSGSDGMGATTGGGMDASGANTSGAAGGGANAQSDPNNVAVIPFQVTKEVLDRGQERYQIYCSMCHGMSGYGDGMVVRRGYKVPTSYHDSRLRQERVGHFYDVITNGWGSMPKYAAQITPRDRWAIVAYIRALQLSQGASINDIPEAERQQLLNGNSPVMSKNPIQIHSSGHNQMLDPGDSGGHAGKYDNKGGAGH